MRVLHLSSGNLYGGVETYLATLARLRHLCPEMEPAFGLCFPGRVRDELTAGGVEVHDLGPVRLSRPWTVVAARRRLRAILSAGGFDVVVCHSSWPHVVFAPVARAAGVRLAHAVHADYTCPSLLDQWAARTPPDVVLANSRYTAAPAAALFRPAPVEVVYLPVAGAHPVDRAAARREVRAEFGTPPDAVVFLQASRLERWKGQEVHVQALAHLRAVPGWEAWFAGGAQKAGEATFMTTLRAAAARAGVADRVRFLGQRWDIPRLMAAADVYCQPNTGPEPFGLSFVEALYSGLPVVTSGFGGGAEIVDGSCGVLTPPCDAAGVAAALESLLTDPVQRASLGSTGPARARELCDPLGSLTCLYKAVRPHQEAFRAPIC